MTDSEPIVNKRVYGVKLSTFEPDSLSFEVVFQAAGFSGWTGALKHFLQHYGGLGPESNYFWHVLFEAGEKGRIWSLVEKEDIYRIANLNLAKPAS